MLLSGAAVWTARAACRGIAVARNDGRPIMNVITACRCVIAFSMFSSGIPATAPASAASGVGAEESAFAENHETRKPAGPRGAGPHGTTQGTTAAGNMKQNPMPPDRAQIVEERVRSGHMEQPIAQGEISERLNQMERGTKRFPDDPAAGRR